MSKTNTLFIVLVVVSGLGIGWGSGAMAVRIEEFIGRSFESEVKPPVEREMVLSETTKAEPIKRPKITQKPDVFQGSCGNGFAYFENDDFSICFPNTLVQQTESTSSAQIFVSKEEMLIVEIGASKKPGLHLCNLEKEVTVATSSAIRLQIKKETNSGCGNIVAYSTVSTSDDNPFTIHFEKLIGGFNHDVIYQAIEQSLKIK